MSSVKSITKPIIAILCADIHLSSTPPIWRSNEPDWYAAMKRPLDELKMLQKKYGCPIFCAGDMFDKWNSSAELINWTIDNLPEMYAIPGQHDLPNHNLKEIKKSAYWTLVKAGKIIDIGKREWLDFDTFMLIGFPFGIKQEQNQTGAPKNTLMIAIAHQYVWTKGCSHPNALPQDMINPKNVSGYDVVIFGDNHKEFGIKVGKTVVFNCGSLIRRRSDEEYYTPQVGVLYSDGTIAPHFLDTSKDKHLKLQEGAINNSEIDLSGFIRVLEQLGDCGLDFKEAIKAYLQDKHISNQTKTIIYKAMGL